jgi:hypothetical protein
MTTHTAGPWSVQTTKTRLGLDKLHIATRDNVTEIAIMRNTYAPRTLANARLIAAAPDMLDALCRIADGQWPDNIAETEGTLAMREVAREAIAKATEAHQARADAQRARAKAIETAAKDLIARWTKTNDRRSFDLDPLKSALENTTPQEN